ncbi:MAG: tetratricopeptide repeat protein [Acidobacteriota bacterium]
MIEKISIDNVPDTNGLRPTSHPVHIVVGSSSPSIPGLTREYTRSTDSSASVTIDADFEHGGPWAGLRELFETIVEYLIEQPSPQLAQYSTELAYVVPKHKKKLGVRHQTLTDLAPPEEKVRNYPADRAYRVVNGLVDLIETYTTLRFQGKPLLVVAQNYHHASHIGQRFFSELVRRRGSHVHLLLLIKKGSEESVSAQFEDGQIILRHLNTQPKTLDQMIPPRQTDRLQLDTEARELEKLVGDDLDAVEIFGPRILRLYKEAGNERAVFRLECRCLEVFNSLGFYEDALVYGYRAWRNFDTFGQQNQELRWALLIKMFMSNVGLQQGEQAAALIEESKILDDQDLDQSKRAQLYYLMSMLYVRFLEVKDLDKGEQYLEDGLINLEAARATLSDHDYHFYYVFNRNGLALVRHFQGRYQEAIELCRDGFDQLEEHLSGEQHKLHRSVLLYNIGQVHSAMSNTDEAIRYYSKAMEMDPNYSEYHNERGSLYLRQGRYEEAIADYHRAIELSPPYVEVWTNLGQCYRQVGQFEAAIQAYSRGLDLDPNNLLAAVGRGQAFEGVEQLDLARSDYDHALALDPEQWDTLGSRAVVLYQLGELELSLQDLDRAIDLNPEHAELYFNRSVARQDLGRTVEAIEDLRAYLQLSPAEAEDRGEVEERIQTLLAA